MKRQDKIKAVALEIKNFERTVNADILWPLPDKLKELLLLFDVKSENHEFINHLNEVCIEMIKCLIKDCKDCFGKNDDWTNLTVKQVKGYALNTITKFKRACEYFNEIILLEQEI